MRNFFLIIIIIGHGFMLNAKVVQLFNILKPENLIIDKNQIYITSGEKIFIYSKNDYRLKKVFGKKGEGPSEFKVFPIMGVRIHIQSDVIMVRSIGRISYFSLDGKFIRERALLNAFSSYLTPLKENFISRKSDNINRKTYFSVFNLLNSKFDIVKEISRYKEHFVWVGTDLLTKHPLTRKSLFKVYKNRVYISGCDGFQIFIYDHNGNYLKSFSHKIKKTKVSLEESQQILKNIKNKGKRSLFLSRLWPKIKKVIKVPEYYPDFRNFLVVDDRIYVFTYRKKNKIHECIIFDLEGKLIKTTFLPLITKSINEINPYYIKNNTLYQIAENEDTEIWELHINVIDE